MKLSSISLIASALAATAGNTIAAPGPLHARSLEQGNLFERDIDSVDLFTRSPPDGSLRWPGYWPNCPPPLPEPDWNYPVGPTPQPYVPRHRPQHPSSEELHNALWLARSSLIKAHEKAREAATTLTSEDSDFFHHVHLGRTYAHEAVLHHLRLRSLQKGKQISGQTAQDWKKEAEEAVKKIPSHRKR